MASITRTQGLCHLYNGETQVSGFNDDDLGIIRLKCKRVMTPGYGAQVRDLDFFSNSIIESYGISRTKDDLCPFPTPRLLQDRHHNQHNTRDTKSEAIQGWLFFALLFEVFGRYPSGNDFEYSDFVTSDENHISTARLTRYLENWKLSQDELRDGGNYITRNRRFWHVQRVLEYARLVVSRCCSATDDARSDTAGIQNYRSLWPIDEMISLSIIVLGETLMRANYIIHHDIYHTLPDWPNHLRLNQGWGLSGVVLRKMRHDLQSCPRVLHMLKHIFRHNTIGFLNAFRLRASGHDDQKNSVHAECTTQRCYFERPNPQSRTKKSSYIVRHVCEQDPSCTSSPVLKPDMDRVKCLTNRGNVPVFRYNESDKTIEVKSAAGIEYAAISHVWRDGFGNPTTNGVYPCVLAMINRLLCEIKNQDSGRHYFWMDTLALPVGDDRESQKVRSRANGSMHITYSKASFTLVLDSTLMKHRIGAENADVATRISLSPWMRRLWTLQEAAYSSHLCFLFKDGPLNMRQPDGRGFEDRNSLRDAKVQYDVTAVSHTYLQGILAGTELGRKTYGVGHPPSIASVLPAVQWRTTSWLQYEALILAILFQVEFTKFVAPPVAAGEEPRQKELDILMEHLIQALIKAGRPIPADIIFVPGARLSTKYYGWCPRSWLSENHAGLPSPKLLGYDQIGEFKSHRGLKVQYPGIILWRIRPRGNARLNEIKFRSVYPPYRVYVAVVPKDYTGPKIDLYHSGDCALIMQRMPPREHQEIAVLVAISKENATRYPTSPIEPNPSRPYESLEVEVDYISLVEISVDDSLKHREHQYPFHQRSDHQEHDEEYYFMGAEVGESSTWLVGSDCQGYNRKGVDSTIESFDNGLTKSVVLNLFSYITSSYNWLLRTTPPFLQYILG